jgi:hypothetical protein
MNELTYYCDRCPKIDFETEKCSAFLDTSWVDRLGGCCMNKVGVIIKVKTQGQQKQGRFKVAGAVDLTQAGLFPEWNAIGIGWKCNVEMSKKVGMQTRGTEKAFGKASAFARYCAYSSRAQYHRNYQSQIDSWDKAKR